MNEDVKWICSVCGYVYDGPDFEAEPDTYVCPVCKASKDKFVKQ
ncbi:MAG: rubredoxin [Erysipelotrichia bacterium]|nr:rubredoxin [Erysipelotrichia bacterium]NCC55288.1 rubredoxin [Erysipelotrichia bacterium]